MDQVEQTWRDSGFPAAARLWSLVKDKGLGVTQKQVKDFLAAQEVMQLHRRAPVDRKNHHITSAGNQLDYTADLLDLQKYKSSNSGMSWCLLVEDIFNRKAFMRAIRTKSPEDVRPALEEAFKALGTPDISFVTDKGSEFKASVDKLLSENRIVHHTVEVGDHRTLGMIDSLSRFVKNALHKHFTHSQSTKWIDYIPMLMQSYNNTPHSSLKGMTPSEAEQRPTDTRNIAYDMVMKDAKPARFEVGDTVRVLKRKLNPFTKGYEIRYSLPTYTISSVDGKYYVLSSGKRVREHELQKVTAGKEKPEAEPEAEEEKEVAADVAASSLAPGRRRSPTPEPVRVDQESSHQGRRDVARQAKHEARTESILKHKEGISQSNRREGLRERSLASMLRHPLYGDVRW